MNLEPNTQSEVSQKEKDKYHILMHIYGIQKNGTEYLQGNNGETYREQTYGHGERGGKGEMCRKSNMETYITICKIDSHWEFAVWLRKTQTGPLYQPRGVEWGGRWEGGSEGKGYVYTYG